MNLQSIKLRLKSQSIFFSEALIGGRPAVIGYEKKFKWQWFATQLNTFVVAIDFGDEPVDVAAIEAALSESFTYATRNHTGWPRGLQSGVGVICFLISSRIDALAIDYCRELKAGKKWAGFAVPVVIDSSTAAVHQFHSNPVWGLIYFPYFRELIGRLLIVS
jgi:hypothetical protein